MGTRPTEDLLTENLAAMLKEFGPAPHDETVGNLADGLRRVSADAGTVDILAGAFMATERCGFGHALGVWLADTVLTQRLGWAHALPLLGGEAITGRGTVRPRRSEIAIAASIHDEGA